MQDYITVTYVPLLLGNITHKKTLYLSTPAIYGFIVMSGIISCEDKMRITLSSDKDVDLSKYQDLANNGTIYTSIFLTVPVSFDDLDFINGASKACLLLGIDPSSVIKESKKGKDSIIFKYNQYIDYIPVVNTTKLSDGSVVNIDFLREFLDPNLVNSMRQTLLDCFPSTKNVGIIIPSTIYMVTNDPKRTDVASVAMITPYIGKSLSDFSNLGAHTIFNVCSSSKYKEKGFAKSVLVALLNSNINKGIKSFILEVDPDNLPAVNLYKSLGFNKIGTSKYRKTIHDVMHLNL